MEQLTYDHNWLIAAGYKPLDRPPTISMPTFSRIVNACRKQNVTHGGVVSFRTAEGWRLYITPDATPGFKDEPLFPPPPDKGKLKLPYATECVLKAGGVSLSYFCTRHRRYIEGVSLYTNGDFEAACPHCLLEKEPAPGAAEAV